MNLTDIQMKFDIKNNPALQRAIRTRLVELGADGSGHSEGYDWLTVGICGISGKYIPRYMCCWYDGPRIAHLPVGTINDLYKLPKTYTITIADKDIELSAESFHNLKKQLKD